MKSVTDTLHIRISDISVSKFPAGIYRFKFKRDQVINQFFVKILIKKMNTEGISDAETYRRSDKILKKNNQLFIFIYIVT